MIIPNNKICEAKRGHRRPPKGEGVRKQGHSVLCIALKKWWLPSFWRAELCDAGNVNGVRTASISIQRDITGSYNSPLQADWFFRNGFMHAELGW